MQMKKKIFTILLLVTACIFTTVNTNEILLAKKKKKEMSRRAKIKHLDKKYQDWLDLVYHIITPLEKQVFFKLTTNNERDTFINLFWNLRDPTKGTPDNEYKKEHIERFTYANRYFGFTSPLPGWKTDRGKFYILLGPPVHRNEIRNNGLYPLEIWEYSGGVKKGLPPVFRLVFYRPYSSGDYKLYIPSVDTPIALLRSEIGQVDPNDYYQVYSEIKELDPTVAEVSLTLIPGESLVNYTPSLQSPILISQIYDLPKKRINATYARNFLNFKGIVETSVMTNYVNIKSDLYLLKDPLLNLHFIHFALLPDKISVDYSPERDQYYFSFDLMVVLKKGETTVFQYNKNYPFYYSKADLDQRLSHGIIITDYFPVIDGQYKVIVILQNLLNKELSYYEEKIDTRTGTASKQTLLPRIYGPLVSYQVNHIPQSVYSSFNVMGTNVKIDPRKSFGLKDTLYSFFSVDKGSYKKPVRVELDVKCTDETREYLKQYSFALPGEETFKNFSQKLESLNYGNYIVTTRLIGENKQVLDEQENEFQVSPMNVVPHPPLASKTLKNENRFLFHMMIAQQYENVKDFARSELYFEKAYGLNSSFPELIKGYASLLLKMKKYDKMLSVIENLKGREKEAFHYFSFKGRGFYRKGLFQEAVNNLLEANKIYDSDTAVLNTLGLSFIKLGDKEEAIKALSASLKVNDTQADIAGVLQQLKKKN